MNYILQTSSLKLVYQLPDPDEAIEYWLMIFRDIFDKHVLVRGESKASDRVILDNTKRVTCIQN